MEIDNRINLLRDTQYIITSHLLKAIIFKEFGLVGTEFCKKLKVEE